MNTERKRMLLLEDDAGDARLLEMMLLQVAPGEFEVKRAERLAEAKKLLVSDHFDVILSDLGVPDSRGLMTFAHLMAQAPDTPIVVFSNLDDESTAMEAVQRGAEDYLMKGQVNGTSVVRALRYAIERRKNRAAVNGNGRQDRGRLLAFLGAKGGVGTTTVALNVASSIAKQGKGVILVELHADFSPLSLMLRTEPAGDLSGALALGPGEMDERALSDKLVCLDSGLRVLFGPQRLVDFQALDSDRVDSLLQTLLKMAAIVIVDLPSSMSPASQAALRTSNYTTVVVEREMVSLSCGCMQLDTIEPWGPTGNRVGAMLVSRVPLATPPKLAEVRSLLSCDIVGMIPPAFDECALAHNKGIPLIQAYPTGLATEALTQAAARLAADHVAAMRVE